MDNGWHFFDGLLHQAFEVGVGIKTVQVVSQALVAEDVLLLWRDKYCIEDMLPRDMGVGRHSSEWSGTHSWHMHDKLYNLVSMVNAC